MLIGLVVFGAASLAAALAASPGQLIAGRVLMGVGGALVMPSMLSILITVFSMTISLSHCRQRGDEWHA